MAEDAPFRTVPVITLDGLAGSGKSTLAKALATALGWPYLDSGAWYRALTWAVLAADRDPASAADCEATLSQLSLTAALDGTVAVDGNALGAALRTPAIDAAVGLVADHPGVRRELNRRMRHLADSSPQGGLVADGRDAGTVIFPDAALQVFVMVPLAERARRRWQQYRSRGLDSSLPEVEAALAARDARDLARGDAAPRLSARGRELDNQRSVEEVIGDLLTWVEALGLRPSSAHETQTGGDPSDSQN